VRPDQLYPEEYPYGWPCPVCGSGLNYMSPGWLSNGRLQHVCGPCFRAGRLKPEHKTVKEKQSGEAHVCDVHDWPASAKSDLKLFSAIRDGGKDISICVDCVTRFSRRRHSAARMPLGASAALSALAAALYQTTSGHEVVITIILCCNALMLAFAAWFGVP
jgi:hypothetical protein